MGYLFFERRFSLHFGGPAHALEDDDTSRPTKIDTKAAQEAVEEKHA